MLEMAYYARNRKTLALLRRSTRMLRTHAHTIGTNLIVIVYTPLQATVGRAESRWRSWGKPGVLDPHIHCSDESGKQCADYFPTGWRAQVEYI
jgi:hypothetical protein